MSLIHQALEKLDGEKKGISLPVVEKVSAEKEKKFQEENTKLLYWLGGALLLLFVLGLVYLLGHSLFRSSESSRVTPATVSSARVGGPFSLTGITRVGSEATAIVNNELVRVGDRVSGATVKAIEDERVLLDFRGQTVMLNLHGETS